MNAILSGQTGIAVLIDGGQLHSYSLNAPESWNVRHEWEIPLLFADADDIIQLENISQTQAIETLKLEWAKDRSLQLTLILLDPEEERQTRFEASECLDAFFNQGDVRTYVENHLYSAPLPSIEDLNGAIQISKDASLTHIEEFLYALKDNQDEIAKRFAAWEALPVSLFGGPNDKNIFYYEAVKHGAFRLFVAENKKKNLAILQLLSHPHFRGNVKARKIFQAWAAPFKESATSAEFEMQEIERGVDEQTETTYRRRSLSAFEIYRNVERQKEAIKKQLIEGKQSLVLQFTEELIKSQRQNSEPEQTAKSLCDLAQYAKDLGSRELQLEFAMKAVAEAPYDAWAHATLGDAYRLLGNFQESLKEYHTAGMLGNNCVALTGRAEVLKDLGQQEEVIQIYTKCIENFPSEIVPLNGWAAAYAHFGKFEQALDAYEEILRKEPFDLVTNNGHAQVLLEMGRSDEALKKIKELAESYPREIIPQCALVDALREIGKLDEAKITVVDLIDSFPLAAEPRFAYIRILQDLGYFSEALDEAKKTVIKFPLNAWSYLHIANAYKRMGKLSEALEMYEQISVKFSRSTIDRNGRASVLVAMGDYKNALSILPTNLPATKGEWIAYHIRGMAQLRSGNMNEAAHIFERGLKENPWTFQSAYFKTALASVRLQQERYKEVPSLVQDINHPSVESIARVIAMHAYGELGHLSQFDQSYESIKNTSAPVVIELREALAMRYRQQTTVINPNSWFFLRECDALLQAA